MLAVIKGGRMPYEPPFARNDAIDSLCMEIAELVGMTRDEPENVSPAHPTA